MPNVKLLDPADAGRHLDRYELIGEIASGGMATVFLARLAGAFGFQRFVAIKRLHPHLAREPEFVEMFLDEARHAAGIHHPHVVPILEVGTCGEAAGPEDAGGGAARGGFYVVMEYVEGDTLAQLFSRAASSGRPLSRPVLLRVVLDTLAGLHAAHELTDNEGRPVDLVHRDCSPQNVLVGVDGCSRITDFGVAYSASCLSSTRPDRLKGKLAYMAPEQVRGGAIDRRADVFAMGIVLWEVLSGRRLFKAENGEATLSRVVLEPIPRLRDVAPELPPALDAVCAKALDREPSRRYQSAAEMAEAIERAVRDAGASIASAREVAAAVQAVLGQEIAVQRERVRAWLHGGSGSASSRARPRGGLAAPPASERRSAAPSARAGSEDLTLSAPSIDGSAWRPSAPPGPGGAVIPVDLPPDPPIMEEDESTLAAREASFTGAHSPSRHPSLVPYATAVVEPVARRRGRLAGVLTASALVGVGLFCWKVTWPRAAMAVDQATTQAASAPARAAMTIQADAAAVEPPVPASVASAPARAKPRAPEAPVRRRGTSVPVRRP